MSQGSPRKPIIIPIVSEQNRNFPSFFMLRFSHALNVNVCVTGKKPPFTKEKQPPLTCSLANATWILYKVQHSVPWRRRGESLCKTAKKRYGKLLFCHRQNSTKKKRRLACHRPRLLWKPRFKRSHLCSQGWQDGSRQKLEKGEFLVRNVFERHKKYTDFQRTSTLIYAVVVPFHLAWFSTPLRAKNTTLALISTLGQGKSSYQQPRQQKLRWLKKPLDARAPPESLMRLPWK